MKKVQCQDTTSGHVSFNRSQQRLLDTLINRSVARTAEKFQQTVADLESQRDKLLADKADLLISAHVNAKIAEHSFIDSSVAYALLRPQCAIVDGDICVVTPSGERRFDADGRTPVTVAQIAAELVATKPFLLRQEVINGVSMA